MKKKTLLLLLALLVCPFIQAEKTPIKIVFHRIPSSSSSGGGIGRVPVIIPNLPVNITFDDETGEMVITDSNNMNGCVYIYSIDGIQEGYSPELNATFTLPQTDDIHIISLQGSNWFGEGKVVY